MALKDDLLPTGRNRVIDLVKAAGASVADWGSYSRGPTWAATNPKYCYEWSFVEPGNVVVLNLWHAHISEVGGVVSLSHNMRADAQALAKQGAKSIWVTRALRFDNALQLAIKDGLKIRVIINEGTMRTSMGPKSAASKVRFRRLDPIPWTLASYDPGTGHYVVVRGGKAIPFVDQFDLPLLDGAVTEQVDVSGKAYVRKMLVRQAALKRANGRCEYCGQVGFDTTQGGFFLETHHIISLSNGGPDILANVAAVCPNHHREAHHGARSAHIRDHLLEVASK